MSEIFLSIIVIALGGVIVFLLLGRARKGANADNSLLLIQNQLQDLRNTVDEKLGSSAKMFQEQFKQSTTIIKEVTEKLTRLDETNKQVLNFSDQLQRLQDILKNPKQRGVLGEYYLKNLLQQAFHPKQYQMQYEFKNGEKVDAVLFLGEKILPIDSKFSLENYNRIVEEREPLRREELERLFVQDLKDRIEETAKYIRPQESTTEYALMFIPAEGIFSDLLDNKIGVIKANTRNLIDYAVYEKRVHIVSPTTFYVTLQSILQGMRMYQVQESTKEILENIGVLQKHLKAYNEYLQKLGGHLGTAINTYNTTYKEFGKIDKDFLRITGKSNEIDPLQLDHPKTEEDQI